VPFSLPLSCFLALITHNKGTFTNERDVHSNIPYVHRGNPARSCCSFPHSPSAVPCPAPPTSMPSCFRCPCQALTSRSLTSALTHTNHRFLNARSEWEVSREVPASKHTRTRTKQGAASSDQQHKKQRRQHQHFSTLNLPPPPASPLPSRGKAQRKHQQKWPLPRLGSWPFSCLSCKARRHNRGMYVVFACTNSGWASRNV
jgi:hypothetical protein